MTEMRASTVLCRMGGYLELICLLQTRSNPKITSLCLTFHQRIMQVCGLAARGQPVGAMSGTPHRRLAALGKLDAIQLAFSARLTSCAPPVLRYVGSQRGDSQLVRLSATLAQ